MLEPTPAILLKAGPNSSAHASGQDIPIKARVVQYGYRLFTGFLPERIHEITGIFYPCVLPGGGAEAAIDREDARGVGLESAGVPDPGQPLKRSLPLRNGHSLRRTLLKEPGRDVSTNSGEFFRPSFSDQAVDDAHLREVLPDAYRTI